MRCQRDKKARDGVREGRRDFQPRLLSLTTIEPHSHQQELHSHSTSEQPGEPGWEGRNKTETVCEFMQALSWKQSSRAEVLKQREITCQRMEVPVCQAKTVTKGNIKWDIWGLAAFSALVCFLDTGHQGDWRARTVL